MRKKFRFYEMPNKAVDLRLTLSGIFLIFHVKKLSF